MKLVSFLKALPLFLAVVILVGLLPVSASAAGSDFTLSGVWVFNESIVFDGVQAVVNFTSNGALGEYISVSSSGSYIQYSLSGDFEKVFVDGKWTDDSWRTLDFGSTGVSVPEPFYNWFTANASQPSDITDEFADVLSVFTIIGTWLAGSVSSLMILFYAVETGLTVVGVLAVAALAISVILLIVYLIARWLKLK